VGVGSGGRQTRHADRRTPTAFLLAMVVFAIAIGQGIQHRPWGSITVLAGLRR
jgi:hypothetical protein